MEQEKLYRTKKSMIGGVCGGIAEYFGMDKSVIRIIFVLLALAGFSGLLLYLIIWLIVPLEIEN
jgi:phage shock protein C